MKPEITSRMRKALVIVSALLTAPSDLLATISPNVASERTFTKPDIETKRSPYQMRSQRQVDQGDAAAASKLRTKSIQSIHSLLKTTQDRSRRYELLRRLGELYVEHYEYTANEEANAADAAFVKWEKQGRKGAAPKLKTAKSDKAAQRAVETYSLIAQHYPNYPDADIVHYELGKMLVVRGDQAGVKHLERLLKEFPRSGLVVDANILLAEYFFERHDILTAKRHYAAALADTTHPLFPYAMYKMGWAHYNSPASSEAEVRQNMRHSLDSFKGVVALADKQSGNKVLMNLREEAIRDMIVVWADVADVNAAWSYFSQIGSQASFYLVLERLGAIYSEQGKYVQAVAVYERILREDGNRKNAPELHRLLVDIHATTGNQKSLMAALSTMTERYLDSGVWVKANRADTTLISSTRDDVEFLVRRHATLNHRNGRDKKIKAQMALAAGLYELYLKKFAANQHTYEMSFYLADLYYDMGMHNRAADQYLAVVDMNRKNGKYLEDAAFQGVMTSKLVVESAKYGALPPFGKALKAVKIPALKLRLVKAIDQYGDLFPAKPDALPMRLSAAKIHFGHGYYDESMRRLKHIVSLQPTSAQADESVDLMLGFYVDRKQWDAVIATSKDLMAVKGFAPSKRFGSVQEAYRSASFNRALAFETAKQYRKAADSFIQYANEFSAHNSAPVALYNGILNDQRAENYERIFATAQALLKNHPKFERSRDAMAMIADLYEQVADYESAARSYEQFAQQWPKDNAAGSSLFNAGVLYSGLGRWDDSVRVRREFIRRFGSDERVPQVRLGIALALEKSGKLRESRHELLTHLGSLKSKQTSEALELRAVALRIGIQLDGSDSLTAEIKALERDLLDSKAAAWEARRLVAGQRFAEAETLMRQYSQIRFVDANTLEREVPRKQAAMQKMAAAYEAVLAIKDSNFSAAALYRLGEAHEEFSRALLSAKAPQSYTESQARDLSLALIKAAEPLRVEAEKYYLAAYQQSSAPGQHSDWTRRSYVKMAEMEPRKFGSFNELYSDPNYYGYRLRYDRSFSDMVNAH